MAEPKVGEDEEEEEEEEVEDENEGRKLKRAKLKSIFAAIQQHYLPAYGETKTLPQLVDEPDHMVEEDDLF